MATAVAMPESQPRQLYSYIAQPQFYSDHHHPDRLNTPDGPISIAFTRSSRRSIHTNNDLVKGVVHVQARLRIKRVSIQFVGRTTCRVTNERYPTQQNIAEVDLFHHEKELTKTDRPSATCPPSRVEYPFEFRFPEAVEEDPKLQNDAPFKPDIVFEHEKGHALPPSLWWNESTIRNEYFLKAEFVTEQTSFTLNPIVVKQLRFSPSVPEQGVQDIVALSPAPPIRFDRRSRPSTPEPSQIRLGPLKRIKTGLRGGERSEDVSSASLLVLSVPAYYRVGSENSLKLSLQATLTEGDTRPIPVYIRGIRAQVTAHIAYRIPVASAPNEEVVKDGLEKFDLFNKRYSKPGVEITDSTILDGFDINTIVPPTFKTYGVALRYTVKYDLLLECGGKESQHEVETQDIIIEPMTRPGGYLGPPEDPPPRLSDESVVLEDMMRGDSGGGGDVFGLEEPPAYA